MEEPLSSIFNHQEINEQLRQKLLETTHELETTRKERDEAIEKLKNLEKFITNIIPSISKNNFIKNSSSLFIPQKNLVTLPIITTKANSSITESNSTSHDSHLDSSPPEFSNIHNNNMSQNLGCYSSEKQILEFSNAIIDFLAKDRILPQKGKLLDAVMEAGPLLQTLILAGPLPSWTNPPPFKQIQIPPIKEFCSPENQNSRFALVPSPSSMSNSWQLNSIAKFKSCGSPRNRQRNFNQYSL